MPIRFSIDQVNRYLIHKQGLTPASQVHLEDTSLPALLCRFGILRAGAPATPYLSLWARTHSFERDLLDEALYGERTIVRIPAMHARLYMVPTSAYTAYFGATSDITQRGIVDLDTLLREATASRGAPIPSSEELARRILEVMSAGLPMTIEELASWLPQLNERLYHDPDQPELGYSRLGTRLIPAMCARGLLVRAQPHNGWRSTQFCYASLSAWVPQVKLDTLSRRQALQQIILAYIRAFGPVTIGDISHWLGMPRRRDIVSALMALRSQTRHMQTSGTPCDYIVASDQLDALAEASDAASVSLLPPGDSFVAAYSDLSRFVPQTYVARLTDRAGEPYGTIWQNATIVGIWAFQRRDEGVRIRFFDTVSPQLWATVGEKARDMASVLDMSTSLDMQIEEMPANAGTDTKEALTAAGLGLPIR